jgi:16S rRNA (cytosine967-C5)-methyltransferase
VLDACAAPGGKTTHLAALGRGRAKIVASDVSEGRVRLLRETLARTGAPGVRPLVHDFAAGPLPPSGGGFDKILVDAPCTGMGVIRRNPDAKWRFRPDWPAEMARLQSAVLDGAWTSLRPGGVLLYCTCSPFREENEEVVASFLARHPDGTTNRVRPADWPGPEDGWTPEGFLRITPDRHGTDGFFAALLRRDG